MITCKWFKNVFTRVCRILHKFYKYPVGPLEWGLQCISYFFIVSYKSMRRVHDMVDHDYPQSN